MTTYQVTGPDGRKYRVTAPNGVTQEQALARAQAQIGKVKPDRKWSDIPGQAIENTPKSLGNFLSGIYQSVRHPLDTATNVLDIAAGAATNILPTPVRKVVEQLDWNPKASARAVSAANAAGSFYKDRYGSMRGLKETLATDPVGAASDLSAVLSAGAALAGKAPALAGVLKKGADYTNPINLGARTAKAVARPVGKTLANTIGALGTHTGGMPIQEAAKAGYRGGQAQADFIANMRGKVPMTDVLDAAKGNLAQMGQAKARDYRSNMAKVSGDKSVLSFDGIDKAIGDATGLTQFKGQVKNARAAKAVQDIGEEIAAWKSLNPSDFHTPEGLDALKQKVGAITEGIPFEEKTARLAAGKIYNSIKDEIVKQAPSYSKTMKDYSDASSQIGEIEKALSLGNKASVDTAMRKLQSLTRNNVNTNYGNRVTLAQELEKQGGQSLMPSLAGQALNTWVPRGLGGTVAGGVGMGGYALGGAPLAAGTLALQSPRLVGEAALKVGQGARAAKIPGELLLKKGVDPSILLNYMALLNRDQKQ